MTLFLSRQSNIKAVLIGYCFLISLFTANNFAVNWGRVTSKENKVRAHHYTSDITETKGETVGQLKFMAMVQNWCSTNWLLPVPATIVRIWNSLFFIVILRCLLYYEKSKIINNIEQKGNVPPEMPVWSRRYPRYFPQGFAGPLAVKKRLLTRGLDLITRSYWLGKQVTCHDLDLNCTAVKRLRIDVRTS